MILRKVSIFLILFSFAWSITAQASGDLRQVRCEKSRYLPEDVAPKPQSVGEALSVAGTFLGHLPSGIYNAITAPGDWEKFSLEDRTKALRLLRTYALTEMARNHFRIESYLYCLSEDPAPRMIGELSFDEPMFDSLTTCEEKVNELYVRVNEIYKNSRVSLALSKSAAESSAFGYRAKYDPQVYTILNPNPSHPFTDVGEFAELSGPEVELALDRYKNAYKAAGTKWFLHNCTNKTNVSELSQEERNKFNEYMRWKIEEFRKEQLGKYFSSLSELPLVAFMPNYLSESSNYLDHSILKSALIKVEKFSCRNFVRNFVRPDKIKSYENTQFVRKGVGTRKVPKRNTAERICSFDPGSNERRELMETVGVSEDLIGLMDRGRRYEQLAQYDQESLSDNIKLFGKEVDWDLVATETELQRKERILKDLEELPTDSEYEDLLEYSRLLPAINRFTSIEEFKKHKEVLMALHEQRFGSEIASDLAVVGVGLAGIVACHFGLKRVPGLSQFARKFSKGALCDVGGGLTLDSYFLDLQWGRYKEIDRSLYFSGFDNELSLLELEQLKDSQFALNLERAFFGVGLVFAAKGSQQVFKLLKNKNVKHINREVVQ